MTNNLSFACFIDLTKSKADYDENPNRLPCDNQWCQYIDILKYISWFIYDIEIYFIISSIRFDFPYEFWRILHYSFIAAYHINNYNKHMLLGVHS